MTRPPPPDQPSPQESAALVEELAAQLAAAADRRASQIVSAPDRSRQVRVRPEGVRTHLSLVEHGQVLTERDVETTVLLEVLGGRAARPFDALTEMIAGG